MRRLTFVGLLILALASSETFSQSSDFLSIPASAFTPRQVKDNLGGYDGNVTGTARTFTANSFSMFAPVYLPHGASVRSLACGGQDPSDKIRLEFTLRRNEPQQANVDMATVSTSFEQTGFQFLSTTSILEPAINNRRFNYYVVAETKHFDVGFCPDCSVAFCTIGFTTP